jgi:hypothetical protein
VGGGRCEVRAVGPENYCRFVDELIDGRVTSDLEFADFTKLSGRSRRVSGRRSGWRMCWGVNCLRR